jgi:aspartate/methionine/tyrosine aminotransferase
MEVLEKALSLQQSGRDITYMCVGEPDVPEHPAIIEACKNALTEGKTGYTHSLGIIELRVAISRFYKKRYNVEVSPDQIIISSGTSPLMLLIFSMLVEHGHKVILTNPCYACYPNYINFIAGKIKYHKLSPKGGDYSGINKLINKKTAALIVNSPSNPTGEVMPETELKNIAALPVPVISDEIYHGLCYEGEEHTMLKFRKDAFIINGFSKAFSMTGWRLGYAIIPEKYIRLARSLHQNLLICAPNFVQWAGIAAIEHSDEILANMRQVFSERRRVLLTGLNKLGLNCWGKPAGAFYALVDFRFKKKDSLSMCMELLDNYGLAVTPGIDFGSGAEGFIRFSYATSVENIQKALEKISKYIGHEQTLNVQKNKN